MKARPTSLRMPAQLAAQIEAVRVRLERETGLRVSWSEAFRYLLRRGLELSERA